MTDKDRLNKIKAMFYGKKKYPTEAEIAWLIAKADKMIRLEAKAKKDKWGGNNE